MLNLKPGKHTENDVGLCTSRHMDVAHTFCWGRVLLQNHEDVKHCSTTKWLSISQEVQINLKKRMVWRLCMCPTYEHKYTLYKATQLQ